MIQIKNLTFAYPDGENVLEDVSLTVEEGEILCVIGHSGSGKSTLLRLIAGLELPQQGSITVNGQKVEGPSYDRTVVFQQYSLFPWLNVKKNVEFALKKTKRFDKKEIEAKAEYFLKKVGLEADMYKYPFQLSGGMRQRTAIARALAMDAPCMLLDEPFGALDTKIRKELQGLLLELWKQSDKKQTVIFVTHDLEEALSVGSRVVFIKDKRIAKEKYISGAINTCCCQELKLVECKALKEELTQWYE